MMAWIRKLLSTKGDPVKRARLDLIEQERRTAMAENSRAGQRLHDTIRDMLDKNDELRFVRGPRK